jgi:hypothetical protein
LPPDAGSTAVHDITIEQILEEKRVFDVSVGFEKLGMDEKENKWKLPGNLIIEALC